MLIRMHACHVCRVLPVLYSPAAAVPDSAGWEYEQVAPRNPSDARERLGIPTRTTAFGTLAGSARGKCARRLHSCTQVAPRRLPTGSR